MKKIGSAGRAQTRTFWNLELIMGIPFSRWGAKPFIISPTRFPLVTSENEHHRIESVADKIERQHPFFLAESWHEELQQNIGLTKAKIAVREGISRARVTQIMNLLRLPEEIQSDLRRASSGPKIMHLSERRLRTYSSESLINLNNSASK